MKKYSSKIHVALPVFQYIVQYVTQTLQPMLYTSYYAMQKALRASGVVLISISRFKPRWCKVDAWMPELAPTREMFDMTQAQYKKEFARILSLLSAAEIVDRIRELSAGRPAALLCYESPEDFCHRHLVAAWLNKNGIAIAEYSKDEQISLLD